jgi:hypothetical protein
LGAAGWVIPPYETVLLIQCGNDAATRQLHSEIFFGVAEAYVFYYLTQGCHVPGVLRPPNPAAKEIT